MRGLLRQFLKNPKGAAAHCLERIASREGDVRAWVEVSPQPALGSGPLDGIPFGVKDIYETRGLATEFGSPVYAGRKGACDAALVTELRELGAMLLGKTHTTAFAYFDHAPTRNPHNPKHTPGGSSSGSAAAVAAGMAAFALGSQTQGSVLRPASFCGVAGFKPTFGTLSTEGVLPFAPTLDTMGLFTQTAEDMRLLWRAMNRLTPAEAGSRAAVVRKYCAGPIVSTVKQLLKEGFEIVEIELPAGFEEVLPAVRLINNYEGARTHEQGWRQHGERIGRKLALLVEEGLKIPQAEYLAALGLLDTMRRKLGEVYREYPLLLTPASPGPAPLGLDSTGDPRCNAPWTGLRGPAISIPMPVEDLPEGLQITAAPGADSALLEAAVRIEAALTSKSRRAA
jgi:Asp-tRNA(Asn)/Glu-tRNA(Gln) amidotransferase A subunit family amidase